MVVAVVSPEHTDEVLGRMEHTLGKVHAMKQAGRRASLAGAEMDLMKLVAETRDIMQATLQKASHHHELLVKIFGGDFVRISRSRAILDHIFFSDSYSAGKQVEEGLRECQAVEDVLKDLGYDVVLQAVQAQELLAFLERMGSASEEEKAAARAKVEAASAAAQRAALSEKSALGEQAKQAKEPEVAEVREEEPEEEQRPKAEEAVQRLEQAKQAKEPEVAEETKPEERVREEEEAAQGEEEQRRKAEEAVQRLEQAKQPKEPEVAEETKLEERVREEGPEEGGATGAAAEGEGAQSEEEQRRKAEEAVQRLEQAKQARLLPSLKTQEALDLQEVEKHGAVEVVKAHDATGDATHPEPAPGARFIVLRHTSLVGEHGTLLQPTQGAGRWAARMDSGRTAELEASQFEVAPAPLARVSLKEPIEFKAVHHGDPPIATYKVEASAMRILKAAASVLKIYSSAVVSIEGHTATPDSKMDEWAQALAQGRADKIKAAFVSLGVEQSRLKPIGLPGKLGGQKHDVVLKLVSF